MAEFRIFPETNNRPITKNRPVLNSKKKNALGDVSNTLQATVPQTKGRNQNNVACPTTPVKALEFKNDVCKSVTSDSGNEEVGEAFFEDLCSECNNEEEDTYLDIRPMSERLSSEDIDRLVMGLWRPVQPSHFLPSPKCPSPTFSLDIEPFDDDFLEIPTMKPLIFPDHLFEDISEDEN